MPSSYVKKIAKAYQKKTKDVEKLWDKAKGIVLKKYNMASDSEFVPAMWAETTGLFKKMVKNKYGSLSKEIKEKFKLRI